MIDVPFANGNIYVDKVLLKFAQQAKQILYLWVEINIIGIVLLQKKIITIDNIS